MALSDHVLYGVPDQSGGRREETSWGKKKSVMWKGEKPQSVHMHVRLLLRQEDCELDYTEEVFVSVYRLSGQEGKG